MNRVLSFTAIGLCVCCFVACDEVPITSALSSQNDSGVDIGQGISGYIMFWDGDFMPTVPGDEGDGTVYPVVRHVYFFTPTLSVDVEWFSMEVEPGFYVQLMTDIPTEPIAIVQSDEDGYFIVALPPGTYSMFVRECGFFYANMINGGGYIFPVEVAEDEVTKVQFDITYMATY